MRQPGSELGGRDARERGKAAPEHPKIKKKKGERAVGRAQVVFKSTEWTGKRESEPVEEMGAFKKE